MAQNMDDLVPRRLSLASWPKKNFFPNLEEFARAGFYYEVFGESLSDQLCCAYCPIVLKDWKEGDNPWLEHAKYHPMCIHLQSVKGRQWISTHACLYRSPPLIVNGQPNNLLAPLLREEKRVEFKTQQRLAVVNDLCYTAPRGFKLSVPPIDPGKGKHGDRARTISNYRRQHHFHSEFKTGTIAAAGFYWPDVAGVLKCYYCGLLVRDWDRNTDPFEIHAFRNPHCTHLVLEKGEEYISYVISKRVDGNTGIPQHDAVPEQNLNTAMGNKRNCDVCGQLRHLDERVCCLKCRKEVCRTRDCTSYRCCEYFRQ